MPSTDTTTTTLTGSRTFNLKELFENNYFIIPDYQRGYSWENEQLADLIKDITNIAGQDNKHYTGTIVASRNQQEANCYQIVDGQQRLTSLVLLLNELYHYDPVAFTEIKKLFLIRGTTGDERAVFTPNLETRACFEAVINRKGYLPSIKSHELIIGAAEYFRVLVEDNPNAVNWIYDTIIHKLSFLFFTPAYDKEIGIMFEVINNRGKPLSELEKIKNFFIYYATVHDKGKLRDDINLNWVNIQTHLSQAGRTSNDDENIFLRNCYLVFFKTSKEKSWNVYEECKKEFDVKRNECDHIEWAVNRMRDFVTFLAEASLHYAWFYNQSYFLNTYHQDSKEDLLKCLTYLRCQPTNASIMPLYLAIMSRMDELAQVLRLLRLLEVVNMRLYVLPDVFRRADSKQGDLFYFAYEFFNDRDWHSENDPAVTDFNHVPIEGDVFEWLYQNLAQITYAFCNTEKLIDNLYLDDSEDFNFYRWTGIRYFLACYEEDIRSKRAKRSFDIVRILSGKKAVGENLNDQLSLEHIWASKNMVEDFPEDFHAKRRLGNFVLCGLSSNISLSANYIPDKIDQLVYYNGAGEGALDMLQIAELKKISEDVLKELDGKRRTKNFWRDLAVMISERREANFEKFALRRWALPNEKSVKKT
jgi:uncharacterized protein with ParB-like and HNH nuclease domain